MSVFVCGIWPDDLQELEMDAVFSSPLQGGGQRRGDRDGILCCSDGNGYKLKLRNVILGRKKNTNQFEKRMESVNNIVCSFQKL